jgi:excinuclease UvrABC nuclease subunit
VEAIRDAPLEELVAVQGITPELAQAIKEHLE